MPKFVLTGASGSGKSSVINALAERGFKVQREIGREVVKEQVSSNGIALPWVDKVAFRDLLFERSVEAFDAISVIRTEPVFFDRSFLDAIAYSCIIGAEVTENMHQQADARRFSDPVLVFPPWEEIYSTNGERQHAFEEAIRDYEANVSTYEGLGYRALEVPKKPVFQRVEFVVRAISEVSA